jgi:ribosomal protein S11/ribosomal protein S4
VRGVAEQAVTAEDLLKEELGTIKVRKAKGSKNVTSGVVERRSPPSTTPIVSITDARARSSPGPAAGKCNFRGSRKSTADAAQVVAQDAARNAMAHGLKEVQIRVIAVPASAATPPSAPSRPSAWRSPPSSTSPRCRTTAAARASAAASESARIQPTISNLGFQPWLATPDPSTRISRRFGQHIVGSGKALDAAGLSRPASTARSSRRKVSEYAVGLEREAEAPLHLRPASSASSAALSPSPRESAASPASASCQLLETRLDSVVYLLGLAKSRAAARQLRQPRPRPRERPEGRHLASYNVQAGDEIEVQNTPASRQLATRPASRRTASAPSRAG